jgi:hypothetical protein
MFGLLVNFLSGFLILWVIKRIFTRRQYEGGVVSMELFFNEQDLVDSVCVYTAEKEYARPESIDVNLAFHAALGFSAIANNRGRTRNLNEQELIDAVAVYLRDSHNFNPDQLFIDLRYSESEGITASIQVKS